MDINKLNSVPEVSTKLRDADSAKRSEQRSETSSSAGVEGARVLDSSVRLSEAAQALNDSLDTLQTGSDIDDAKVQAIRSAIEQGTYHIDPQQLASRFIDLESQLLS